MKAILTTLLLLLSVAACRVAPSAPVVDTSGLHIREPSLGASYVAFEDSVVRTNNCDGASPTTRVDRSLTQGQDSVFKVEVEAGGLVRGAAVPAVLEGELQAKIRTTLGANFSNQSQSGVLATGQFMRDREPVA
jgi:hypothetical protein